MAHFKYLLAGLFVVFATYEIVAQDRGGPGEVFIDQAAFEHNEAVREFTADFTLAFSDQMSLDSFEGFDGSGNVAVVNQFGQGNTATLTQQGIGNMARMNIMGNNNQAGLLQDGNNNRFILNMEGDDNRFDAEQIGDGNELRMDLPNNGQTQHFEQMGTNLTIELANTGNAGGVPLNIRQTGNGASLMIENH